MPEPRSAQEATTGRARVLLVCSNGGHLAQLLTLQPWLRHHDCVWVTFDKTDAISKLAGEHTEWAYHPTTRNVPNLLRNFGLSLRLLLRHRPDLVISTGAGVALPFFVVARVLRIPSVYLEVYDRVDSATLTGRLCRPLASLFLVQWEEQQQLYPSARLVGPLL